MAFYSMCGLFAALKKLADQVTLIDSNRARNLGELCWI